MKFLLKFLLIIVVVIVLAVVFAGGSVVKVITQKMGTSVVGTQVLVENASLNIFSGTLELSGLSVANPVGYSQPYVTKIDSVKVQLNVPTIWEDVVRINHILIDNVHITFEGGVTGNNIQEIQQNLQKNIPESQEHNYDTASSNTQSQQKTHMKKTYHVGILALTNTQLSFVSKDLGEGINVPLSDIRLTNIGTEDKGATAAEVVDKVLMPLFENIHVAALKSVGGLGDRVNELKDKGENMLDSIGSKLKDLF